MSKEKDNFSEKKPRYPSLNLELLYKMVISDDKGMHLLGCRTLEGLLPELPKHMTPSIYLNLEIVEWFMELGFDNKRARVLYTAYKIAKFKTKVLD